MGRQRLDVVSYAKGRIDQGQKAGLDQQHQDQIAEQGTAVHTIHLPRRTDSNPAAYAGPP